MEIGTVNNLTNLSAAIKRDAEPKDMPPNAFGIGRANQPDVKLSAQARILQQNEQLQQQRQQSLQPEEQKPPLEQPLVGNEYIRVSSSVGTSAKNNLSTEKATEMYQSIQKLL